MNDSDDYSVVDEAMIVLGIVGAIAASSVAGFFAAVWLAW